MSQPPGLALPWSLPATNSTALTPGTSHSFGKARSAISFSQMPISSGMPLISTLLSYPLSLPLPPTNTLRCASPPLPRVSTVRVVGASAMVKWNSASLLAPQVPSPSPSAAAVVAAFVTVVPLVVTRYVVPAVTVPAVLSARLVAAG